MLVYWIVLNVGFLNFCWGGVVRFWNQVPSRLREGSTSEFEVM
jgi:hypothetical protein